VNLKEQIAIQNASKKNKKKKDKDRGKIADTPSKTSKKESARFISNNYK
jgi:hypothetical protein